MKKEDTVQCYNCKKLFSSEKFDIANYKYCKNFRGKKRYFCSYSCMQIFKRKNEADKKIIIDFKDDDNKTNKPKGALRINSPAGSQFY